MHHFISSFHLGVKVQDASFKFNFNVDFNLNFEFKIAILKVNKFEFSLWFAFELVSILPASLSFFLSKNPVHMQL